MGRTEKSLRGKEAYNSCFPTRLRILLDRMDETQGKLADAIGVKRQSIGQWKDGTTTPDVISLRKIAEYYDVSADYLIGLKDTPEKTDELLAEKIKELESQIIEIAEINNRLSRILS